MKKHLTPCGRGLMNTYHITLTLHGELTESEALEDRLYETGCDDATLCFNGRTAYLEFDREAASACDAVATAIANVEAAGCQVAHSEQSGFVTLASVAYLSQLPIKTLRAWANGQRGKKLESSFPAPHFGISSGSAVYYWPEVAAWLVENGKLERRYLEVAQAVAELFPLGKRAA